MAKMYPESLAEYLPTDSEKIVYHELKTQLPDTYDVFYSVKWTKYKDGKAEKSEADFIVASPEYGYLCLEVKGGNSIRTVGNTWFLDDTRHGERKLKESPYDQAEKSMYYFNDLFVRTYNIKYPAIYASAVIFPFFAVDEDLHLDNRHRICTIDSSDINDLFTRIKMIFKFWAGDKYGRYLYTNRDHIALIELIKKRIAISAAAGALVKQKEAELSIINRIQDDFIYFIQNVNQFYIKGGAGTGKTWIAMKMAVLEAQKSESSVLFLCKSQKLADFIKNHLFGSNVTILSIRQLFAQIANLETINPPRYNGIRNCLKESFAKYDAIFVDEAQDFTEEWASVVRQCLKDEQMSRFGIFYDDVQILRDDSFGDGFGIKTKPYILRENIRNTANIYKWASEKSNLGKDTVANPVEGPTPQTEIINSRSQLIQRLEILFKEFLVEEKLNSLSVTVVVENTFDFLQEFSNGIAQWKFTREVPVSDEQIKVASIEEIKGLESDMVIYIHGNMVTRNMNYIAYTRAKYYLLEFVRNW